MDSAKRFPDRPDQAPTFFYEKRINGGNEHAVYLSACGEYVYKVPNFLGPVWQDMSSEAAERELGIFNEYDLPILPTEFYDEGLMVGPFPWRFEVDYLFKQPFIKDFKPLGVGDAADLEVRNVLIEILEKREEIYQRHGLSLDLLGGAALKDLIRMARDKFRLAFKPSFTPSVHNLMLVSDPNDGIPSMAICDTRFMNLNPVAGAGFVRERINNLLRHFHDLETGALAGLLKPYDDSLVRKLDMNLVGHQVGLWAANQGREMAGRAA